MMKRKTCGEVFPRLYVPEGNSQEFKASATNTDISHTCSMGHVGEYVLEDHMDWS
jgi:hypothetical protein